MSDKKKAAPVKRSGVGLAPETMAILYKRIGETMAATGKKPTADSVIRAALAKK